MPTGLSGLLAGAHLTYKDRVRIHTMRDCGMTTADIANNVQMSYTTVRTAVGLYVIQITFSNIFS